MSALLMAMLLTGAGGLAPTQGGEKALVPAPAPYPPPRDGFGPSLAPPRRARANLNSYFSVDDYPIVALRAHHEGTTGFRLTVGADGKVADCRVTVPSGSSFLDVQTCRLLRIRARYTPARAADGTPVEGSDSGRVTWQLPEEYGRAGVPMAARPARSRTENAQFMSLADFPAGTSPSTARDHTELRVAVGRQGRVIGCDIGESSGAPALDAAACRIYAARARFEPARDSAGATACDVVWIRVDWRAAIMGQPSRNPAPASAEIPAPLRRQLSTDLCPGWPAGQAAD
jgi:TonB family protein